MFLLTPAMTPFTAAFGILIGLILIELVALLAGASLLGLGLDADTDFDVDTDLDADLEAPDLNVENSVSGLDWLGLGKAPLMIWLAAFLVGFGCAGTLLQSASTTVFGAPFGLAFAVPPSIVAGVFFARIFARTFAELIPKSETSVLSENHLGRRKGIVSQGVAARGKPAEVRVTDGHGNTHYLRAEPLRDEEVIPQGTQVLVLRKSLHDGYRLVALDH